MTYCNPSDVFAFNGEIVQCTHRAAMMVDFKSLSSANAWHMDLRDYLFQQYAKPVQTIKMNMKGLLTTPDVISAVCEYFDLPKWLIIGKCRKREYTLPRHIAQLLACQYTGERLNVIGSFFGNRDHTTVIHGRNTARDIIETNPDVKRDFCQIELLLFDRFQNKMPISAFKADS